MIPGEMFIKDGEIELNAGRKTVTLTVANSGDRPIQVGSHYHFFETNPALKFDRKKARGMRLDIAAGPAVRVEAGPTRDVQVGGAAGKRGLCVCGGGGGGGGCVFLLPAPPPPPPRGGGGGGGGGYAAHSGG